MSISESKDASARQSLYEEHVNPQWVRLLDVLGMNVRYASCLGAELITEDGRHILDFNSSYCVHNLGHNHPGVVRAIKSELDRNGPAMLQGVPELAGELAQRLCMQAGERLSKVFFCSSESEGVEAVIKFARANTKRSGILYAAGGFHGLTCGALSLMDNPFWTAEFGPLLPETQSVPFGDFDQLEKHLSSKKFAAFLSSSRSKRKLGCCFLRQITSIERRNYVGAMERSLCWMRYRPECVAPDRFWRRVSSGLSLTW